MKKIEKFAISENPLFLVEEEVFDDKDEGWGVEAAGVEYGAEAVAGGRSEDIEAWQARCGYGY